jgi:hypothetical protein
MKAIGIINIILGGLNIIMNIVALLLIWVEKIIFTSLNDYMYNDFSYNSFSYNSYMPFDMGSYMSDLLNVMLLSFPVAMIAYIMMLMGGIKILKKNETGIQLTKISSWVCIAWYFAYMAYFYMTMSHYFESMAGGSIFVSIMFIFGSLIGFVFTCGYPIFLLIYFRKPREFK